MTAADGPVPRVCRLLKTRRTLGSVVDGKVVPWEAGEDPTAAYWCIASSGPVGPDDGIAHPHACLDGRACYRVRD